MQGISGVRVFYIASTFVEKWLSTLIVSCLVAYCVVAKVFVVE